MKLITVFYADQVVWENDSFSEFDLYRIHCGQEIYNGAFVYHKQPTPKHVPGARISIPQQDPSWFRMDGTPVLLSDVPKTLHVVLLILQ